MATQTQKNIAEQIAEKYEDGTVYTDEMDAELNGRCEYRLTLDGSGLANEWTKYVFEDGSCIVVGDAWDVGITGSSDECSCWAAERRHNDGCPDVGGYR